MPRDSYQDKQIMQQFKEEAAQVDAYRETYGLTISDTSNAAGFLDRTPTAYEVARLSSKDSYNKELEARIEKARKAFEDAKGVDQTQNVSTNMEYEINKRLLNQEGNVEKWKEMDSQIDELRLLDYQGSMKDIKKVNEIEKDIADEFVRAAVKDQVQTNNSTFAGKVGFFTGSLGLFMNPVESPFNAMSSVVGGGLAFNALKAGIAAGGMAAITQGALRMAAIDQAVTLAQFARDEPVALQQQKLGFGIDPTVDQVVTDYAFASALTLAGSAVGAAIDLPAAIRYRMGAGSRYVQKEVPTTKVEEGEIQSSINVQNIDDGRRIIDSVQSSSSRLSEDQPITQEFVDRFESARSNMDPAEAEVVDNIVDIAKTTPDHLDQEQHATNYQAAARSYTTGEDIQIPYPNQEVKVSEAAPNIKETPSERIQQLETPVPIEKRAEEQASKLEARLSDLPDDADIRAFDEDTGLGEQSKTVGSVKAKLKQMREDDDVLKQVIACWSNGGPKVAKPK